MSAFLWPTVGGVLIGLSAVLLLSTLGRIAGISGILWGWLSSFGSRPQLSWQLVFVFGLIGGALLFHALTGTPHPSLEFDPVRATIAGLLVGIGVRVGNGCTSGHGVCGMSRLSKRSIVATITFMGVAILTVAIYSQLVSA